MNITPNDVYDQVAWGTKLMLDMPPALKDQHVALKCAYGATVAIITVVAIHIFKSFVSLFPDAFGLKRIKDFLKSAVPAVGIAGLAFAGAHSMHEGKTERFLLLGSIALSALFVHLVGEREGRGTVIRLGR